MIDSKRSRNLFFCAFLLVVFINIVVLSGVYVNRRAEPEAELILTERELSLEYDYRDESSGLGMRLNWRVFNPESDGQYSYYHQPEWLDNTKIEELGFDLAKYAQTDLKRRKYSRPLPRDVYLVLENNSPLHRKTIEQAENSVVQARANLKTNSDDESLKSVLKNALENLKKEKFNRSRLYVIDAGTEAQVLRSEYPQNDKYIIAAGVVRVVPGYNNIRSEMRGYIDQISITHIHVSVDYRDFFNRMRDSDSRYLAADEMPRYKARLAYGSRFEPWLVALEEFDGQQK